MIGRETGVRRQVCYQFERIKRCFYLNYYTAHIEKVRTYVRHISASEANVSFNKFGVLDSYPVGDLWMPTRYRELFSCNCRVCRIWLNACSRPDVFPRLRFDFLNGSRASEDDNSAAMVVQIF
jgi:hypothetical protein